jgi:biopolymer transport protein ExbB
MKKVFTLLAVTGLLSFGSASVTHAQITPADSTAQADSLAAIQAAEADALAEEEAAAKKLEEEAAAAKAEAETPEETEFDMIQTLKVKFIEGDPRFMSLVLICLIIGLALSIERIIFLTMATTNNKALIAKVEEALASGGVDAAKEVCRNTRGPVASIFYQGLERSSEGIEMVEKSVIS